MHQPNTFPRLLALALLLALVGSGAFVARAEPSVAPPRAPQAQSDQQRNYLPLVAGAGGLSSAALIDAAEARGELDAETALIYQVFAAFLDPRLPAQYRGNASDTSERELVGQLIERMPQLSPQAQATLEPFLLPPYHSGSWWQLQHPVALAATTAGPAPATSRCGQIGEVEVPPRNQWQFVDSAGGMVRLWWQVRYPEDAAKARDYAQLVDGIWLKLSTLMQRQPPSDKGSTTRCRGGDNRLDISLVDLGHAGETWPYTFAPVATPSYILLKRDSPVRTLIHELMHSFQFAYDVAGSYDEYNWWREATATWAVHYVDPNYNAEHGFAPFMLNAPELPLEFYSQDEQQPGRSHQYGAYLLALFSQLRTGGPALARSSWEQFEHYGNSLAAINALLPGGFAKQWPEFSLANWNRPPQDEYNKQDRLTARAKPAIERAITIDGSGQLNLDLAPADVQHMATQYYRFTFNDDTARGVTFYNGWTFKLQKSPEGAYVAEPLADAAKADIKVQALLKIGGDWQPVQDWTEQPLSFFCRDKQAARVTELVLIVSNSRWQDRAHVLRPAGLPPKLAASNIGCHQWAGTITYKHNAADKGWPGFSHKTTVSNVTWDALAWPPEDPDPLSRIFAPYSFVPAGTIAVEEVYERYAVGTSGPELECGGTARGRKALDTGRLRMGPVLFPDVPAARSYAGDGTMHVAMTMPACESGNETIDVAYFRLPEHVELTVDPTGTLISGSWSQDCSDEQETCSESYSWEFRARREQ